MPIITTVFLLLVAIGVVSSVETGAWTTLSWQITAALWSMVAYALWRRIWHPY